MTKVGGGLTAQVELAEEVALEPPAEVENPLKERSRSAKGGDKRGGKKDDAGKKKVWRNGGGVVMPKAKLPKLRVHLKIEQPAVEDDVAAAAAAAAAQPVVEAPPPKKK